MPIKTFGELPQSSGLQVIDLVLTFESHVVMLAIAIIISFLDILM